MEELPVFLALLGVKVDLVDEVCPGLDDDARVVVVGGVVDEEADVKVAGLVGVFVVELGEMLEKE